MLRVYRQEKESVFIRPSQKTPQRDSISPGRGLSNFVIKDAFARATIQNNIDRSYRSWDQGIDHDSRDSSHSLISDVNCPRLGGSPLLEKK